MRAGIKQLLTGALVFILFLCGCRVGQAEDPHEPPASTAAETHSTAGAEYGLHTLGTLSVGMRCSELPYTGAVNSTVAGFEPSLLKTISYYMGLELSISDMEDPDGISLEKSLATGDLDAIITTYPLPVSLADQFEVTDPYCTYDVLLGVRQDSGYRTAGDLAGQKLVGDRYAFDSAWPYGERNNLTSLGSHESIERLLKLKAEGILLERHAAERYKDVCEGRIRWIALDSPPQTFVLAVRKENTRLLQTLNEKIQKVKEDGTLDRLLTEYIL